MLVQSQQKKLNLSWIYIIIYNTHNVLSFERIKFCKPIIVPVSVEYVAKY